MHPLFLLSVGCLAPPELPGLSVSLNDVPAHVESPAPEAFCAEAMGSLPLAPEGNFIAQDRGIVAHRDACTTALHATAGARESVLEVRLTRWEGKAPARLSVLDLSGQILVEPTPVEAGDAIEVTLQQTGEVFLHLEPQERDEVGNDYALRVRCLEGCEAEYTRYPLVLLHGMGGAESFDGIDYFYRVQDVLEPVGYAIHSPSVTPFATPEARAEEWEVHLDSLVEQGAGRRFNLIGHSQGGLDARYLVSGLGRPDLVASILSVGTPHRGTPMANLLYELVGDEIVATFLVDLGASAFAAFYGLEGDDHSLVDAMGSLTTDALEDFNARVPDHTDVYYSSWAGKSCGALEFSCQDACGGETVDPLLATPHFIISLYGLPNDGMTPIESAVWGDYRGTICADHADEVGLFEDTGSPAFDHLDFYQDEFRRLAELGF